MWTQPPYAHCWLGDRCSEPLATDTGGAPACDRRPTCSGRAWLPRRAAVAAELLCPHQRGLAGLAERCAGGGAGAVRLGTGSGRALASRSRGGRLAGRTGLGELRRVIVFG